MKAILKFTKENLDFTNPEGFYWKLESFLTAHEGTECEERVCGNCGNVRGLWCDRWDGQKYENQTCDEWSETHWCESALPKEGK